MNKKECREQKGGRAGFAKHTRKSCIKPSFHIASPGWQQPGQVSFFSESGASFRPGRQLLWVVQLVSQGRTIAGI